MIELCSESQTKLTGKPKPPLSPGVALSTSSSVVATVKIQLKEIPRCEVPMNAYGCALKKNSATKSPSLSLFCSPACKSQGDYLSVHNSSDKKRTPKEFGSSPFKEKTWKSSKADKVIYIYMESENPLSLSFLLSSHTLDC